MLVLADFAGPMRSRFLAFLGLAGAGAVNIVVGTLCSRNAWVAAAAMAVVGFAILFSGAINGYFAAAGTPALADVHPSGHAHRPLLRGAGAARGVGPGGRAWDLRADAALAGAAASRPAP
jgi:hypothetical protein